MKAMPLFVTRAGILADAELPPPVPEFQIMGMPFSVPSWTAERVRALPEDGNRYEVINGELLVTPAPGWAHQRVLRELLLRLHSYVSAQGLGEVMLAPADVQLDPGTLVQPDLFVTRQGEPDLTPRTLHLALEVLPPATARHDRITKRGLYQRRGIEYWIVDLDARVVERWTPSDERPQILAATLSWQPEGASSSMVVDLEQLFAAALDHQQ